MGHLHIDKVRVLSVWSLSILHVVAWVSTLRYRVVQSYSVETGPSAQLAHADQHAPSTLVPPVCV